MVCLCAFVAGVAFPAVLGQQGVEIAPRVPDAAPAAYYVDSALVLIPVHVTTPLGASVDTLKRENFRLFENDEEQALSVFAHDDAPISIGLLFDSSGSMKSKRVQVAEAAAAFLKTANKQDEFFLVEFNDRAKLVLPFTSGIQEVYSRIVSIKPFGKTALLDAVYLGIRQMKNARCLRKALVILSDGGDNWSRHGRREVENALLESDVQVYAMGIFDSDLATRHPREERDGPALLDNLALQTGGRLYTVSDIDALPAIGERISRELRSQYLLGYAPRHPPQPGKYRRVQVKLTVPQEMPPLRASYRQGYYGVER